MASVTVNKHVAQGALSEAEMSEKVAVPSMSALNVPMSVSLQA